MKIIAFKRAGPNSPLHPEFITEFIDASLLASTEGYETMLEEHFELELAKNDSRHEAHLKHLKEQELAQVQAEKDAVMGSELEEKELKRDFEQFKRWKQNGKKK